MDQTMEFPSPQRLPPDILPEASREERINVGQAERLGSVIGGALLALWGLARGSWAGVAAAAAGGALLYRGVTGRCPLFTALGVDTTAAARPSAVVRIVETFTVDRPREDLYTYWREVENLPHFMRHLESVRLMDDRRSVWNARGPKGLGSVTWEAEVIDDRPGELIAWRSLPGGDLDNAGLVRFQDAPGGSGTEVRVTIEYRPPGGGLAAAAAGLLNPVFSQLLREDIRRFKNLMEAGEVPTVEGQPTGRGGII